MPKPNLNLYVVGKYVYMNPVTILHAILRHHLLGASEPLPHYHDVQWRVRGPCRQEDKLTVITVRGASCEWQKSSSTTVRSEEDKLGMSRRGRGQKVRGGATYESKEIMTKGLPMAEVEVFTYMHV